MEPFVCRQATCLDEICHPGRSLLTLSDRVSPAVLEDVRSIQPQSFYQKDENALSCSQRPNSHFLRKGLIRRMFDVIQQKPMTTMAIRTESVVSRMKLYL